MACNDYKIVKENTSKKYNNIDCNDYKIFKENTSKK